MRGKSEVRLVCPLVPSAYRLLPVGLQLAPKLGGSSGGEGRGSGSGGRVMTRTCDSSADAVVLPTNCQSLLTHLQPRSAAATAPEWPIVSYMPWDHQPGTCFKYSTLGAVTCRIRSILRGKCIIDCEEAVVLSIIENGARSHPPTPPGSELGLL